MQVYAEAVARAQGDQEMQTRLAEEAFDLGELGMAPGEAAKAIGYGMESGVTPEQASSMITVARQVGNIPWDQMTQTISELRNFGTLQEGLGAMVALTREMRPEQAKRALRELPSELRKDNAITKQLTEQGFDVSEMSDMELIDRMSMMTPMDQATLKGLGMSSRTADTLAVLNRQKDVLRQFTMGQIPIGWDDAVLKQAMEDNPFLAQQKKIEEMRANFQVNRQFGSEAAWGMDIASARQRGGLVAQSMGMGAWVDQETGQTGLMLQALSWVLRLAGASEGKTSNLGAALLGEDTNATGSFAAKDATSSGARTVEELEKINKVLERQLDVLQGGQQRVIDVNAGVG